MHIYSSDCFSRGSISEAALAEPNPDLAASPLFQSTRGRSRALRADRLSRKDAWAMGFAPGYPDFAPAALTPCALSSLLTG